MGHYLNIILIKAHTLNNSNRDREGFPKEMLLNGTMRPRDSSQHEKRVIVENFSSDVPVSQNTSKIAQYVYDKLRGEKVAEDKAKAVAKRVMEAFVKEKEEEAPKENETPEEKAKREKKENKTQMIKIQRAEFDAVERIIQKVVDKKPVTDEDYNILRRNSSIDLALFGRFMGHPYTEYKIEGAVRLGHAFGISEAYKQKDFFTALDDLTKTSEHMGDLYFTQGYMCRSCMIDLGVLFANNDLAPELLAKKIEEYLYLLLLAQPKGHETTMNGGHGVLQYAYVEKGKGFANDYCTAYMEAIEAGKGCLDRAIVQFQKCHKNIVEKEELDVHGIEYSLNDENNPVKISDLQKFVGSEVLKVAKELRKTTK